MIAMIVVLALLVGVIVAEKTIKHHVDSINTTDEIVMSIKPDEITSAKWTMADGTGLEFIKQDGKWICSEDTEFPVNQEYMQEFLSHFEEVHASFIIENVDNYAQYGLEEPECTVTLKAGDEESTVKLGVYSVMDYKRYINVGDDKVYLIDDDLMDYVSADRDEFLDNDRAPAIVEVDSVTTSGASSLNAVYDPEGEHAYNDIYEYYNLIDGKYLPLDSTRMYNLTTRLVGLALKDYATYTATEDTLKDYGMDNPVISFTVSGKDEDEATQSFTMYISSVDSGEKDENDESIMNYYCRYNDSSIIYNLDSSYFNYFSEISYNTLRPAAVLNINWDELDSISVTIDGKTYDIVQTSGEETEETEEGTEEQEEVPEEMEETKFYINGQEVEIAGIISQIDYLSINEFIDEKADKTLEFEFTVNLDNENYPSFKVAVYQYDGDNCLVTLNGQTLGLMSRSLAVSLEEAFNKVILSLN